MGIGGSSRIEGEENVGLFNIVTNLEFVDYSGIYNWGLKCK